MGKKLIPDLPWKLRWWINYWWMQDGVRLREQRKHFFRMTGLHSCYLNGKYMPESEVIAVQARKIQGLQQQLNDQRRGYQKKIARLEKRIADRLTPSPDLQGRE